MAHGQHDGEQKEQSNFNRRQFLVRGAGIAGAVLAYPLLSATETVAAQSVGKSSVPAGGGASTLPTTRTPRKIGLLLPQSARYPQLSPNFLAGMNGYLTGAGRTEVRIVADNAPSDAKPGAGTLAQRATGLIQSQHVDILAGMLTPGAAASLATLLSGANMPMLVSTVGENVPRTADRSPNIFYHTLNLWESSYALGTWAAGNVGSRVLIASSLYNAGFDALYAFRMGFTAAGGQVVAVQVTNRPGDTLGFAPVLSTIRDMHPDFVFADYCGAEAVDFLQAYSKSGLASTTPLFGSAFLTSADVLASVGAAASGIRSAASWATSQISGSKPGGSAGGAPAFSDPFSILGYEAAGIIVQALDRAAGNAPALLNALASVQITGPRGTVAMNSATQSTTGPVYLQKVQRSGSTWANSSIAQLTAAPEGDPQVAGLRASIKTGWVGTYLC